MVRPFEHWGEVLPANHQEELLGALHQLIDDYLDDPSNEEPLLVAFLPPKYRHHYDFMFRKKFFACLMTVGYKLADRDMETVPSCTAEELALHTIIEVAKSRLELREVTPDFTGGFYDVAFDDIDYAFLYMGEIDGIEDSPTGALMGIGNLHFDEWFEPFTKGSVHPYVID